MHHGDSLEVAYKSAVNFVKLSYDAKIISKTILRDIDFDDSQLQSEETFPWVLCVRNPETLEITLKDIIDGQKKEYHNFSHPGSSIVATAIHSEFNSYKQGVNLFPAINNLDFQKVIDMSNRFTENTLPNNLDIIYIIR